MSLGRPIVALVYAEVTAPVVRAQTGPLLAALRAAGEQVDAAAFTTPRRLFLPGERSTHRRALDALAQATGRSPITLTHRPRTTRFESAGERLAVELRDRGLVDAVLFCRQPRAALVGIAAREHLRRTGGRGPFVVHDQRGVRPEEYLLSLGKEEAELSADERRMLGLYREQESAACRGADAVVTVSRAMARRVQELHEVAADRVLRLPNHARSPDDGEARRAAARARLGLAEDALVLAYSGTLAAWQLPEATALLARALRDEFPQSRLLLLTPEVAHARAVVSTIGVPGAIVRQESPDTVADQLAAADYGLLLRADSPVNRVACPVKFGEYLAVGARPVLTPQIGDQSDLCGATDLGVVVGLGDVRETTRRIAIDAVRPGNLSVEGREKRRAWARENIAPECAAARLLEFLGAVVPKPTT